MPGNVKILCKGSEMQVTLTQYCAAFILSSTKAMQTFVMRRWVTIFLVCFIAFASAGLQTGMAMEYPPMNISVGEMDRADTPLLDDCCKNAGHVISDQHGHCGLSCAVLMDATSFKTPVWTSQTIGNVSSRLLARVGAVPERPPRISLT